MRPVLPDLLRVSPPPRTRRANGASIAEKGDQSEGGALARAPATIDPHGNRRRGRLVTTRAVNNIDQDVRLNRALWGLGERMARMLGRAA